MDGLIYQTKPGTILYNNLIADIESGRIKIPQFQRKFVWSLEQTASLIDSILKGYPIGTFIIWETDERLRAVRNLGEVALPETPMGSKVQYVLDGQQRMTSLFVALKGIKLKNENEEIVDYAEMYADLSAKRDEQIVYASCPHTEGHTYVKVVDLLNGGIAWMAANYPNHLEQIEQYQTALKTYQFSKIDITDAPIDIATEIFTRINVGGKSLSVFEIMVAKTYDVATGFDLSEKYDGLINELESVNYGTISNSTLLQAIAVCIAKDCTKKKILGLEKKDVINIWPKVEDALKTAVDYFRTVYRIPVSQLLPYDALLVPFAYYFFNHPEVPYDEQMSLLSDYFWRCVMTTRFSSGADGKITQDIKAMDAILSGQQPEYDTAIDISVDALEARGSFSAGSAYIKGMLCILAYHQPLSFVNNALVTISNDWLKQANSKNYHHFFPRAYMRKFHPEVEEWRVNHIGNITIVDDFLNKRKIRDRAPAEYIQDFSSMNPDIASALATHMISIGEGWGVAENDYPVFLRQRLKCFHDEIAKRVILTKLDKE